MKLDLGAITDSYVFFWIFLRKAQGLFNNYITLKLRIFEPDTPNHQAPSRMITRLPFCYFTPDTDAPLYHLFLFFEVEKKQRYAPTNDTSTHVFKPNLSTWEKCSPWAFNYNIIQNTIILRGAVENCYLPHNFLKDCPSKSNIAPWVYSTITKMKHLADGCSRIFIIHSSST